MPSNFWTAIKLRVSKAVIDFGRDTGNVFQALGVWGLAFLVVQIVLGALPMLSIFTLGATIDAMIGARGIGVVTSDVNDQLIKWLIIFGLGFLAYLFSVRFTGKAGEVGGGLRDMVTFSWLFVYLITINQILLALFFFVILGLDSVFGHSLRLRMLGLLAAIIVACLVAQTFVRFTVLRSFTVGEGLTMIAALAVFVVLLKLRIANVKK